MKMKALAYEMVSLLARTIDFEVWLKLNAVKLD